MTNNIDLITHLRFLDSNIKGILRKLTLVYFRTFGSIFELSRGWLQKVGKNRFKSVEPRKTEEIQGNRDLNPQLIVV